VSPEACHTESGAVVDLETAGVAYGDLVAAAATLIARSDPDIELKRAGEFRLIGRSQRRLDGPGKVNVAPSMASIPPARDAASGNCALSHTWRPTSIFRQRRRAISTGCAGSVSHHAPRAPDAFNTGGVAVLARRLVGRAEGRRQLNIQWDEPQESQCSTRAILAALHRNTSHAGPVAAERGDAPGALARSRRIVEASFELPFLAHATMEPMNATYMFDQTLLRPGYRPRTQPTHAPQSRACCIAGPIPSQSIRRSRGGFGRRDATDFVVEAAQVAAAAATPVQLLWTREDDVQFDRYRPAAVHRLRVALDERGFPQAWLDRMSSVSMPAFLEPAETAKACRH